MVSFKQGYYKALTCKCIDSGGTCKSNESAFPFGNCRFSMYVRLIKKLFFPSSSDVVFKRFRIVVVSILQDKYLYKPVHCRC